MPYFSEQKRKRKERIIITVIIVVVALAILTVAALLTYRSITKKYQDENAITYEASGIEHDVFSQTAITGCVYGEAPVRMYDYFYQMAVDKSSRFYSNMNEFLHITRWGEAGYTSILNVDADTLSSVAWLDLTREPVVVYCPDTKGCYYSIELIDFYGNVCADYFCAPGEISQRNFLVAQSGYSNKVPSDMQLMEAATQYVLCYVKLMVPSSAELEAARNIQSQFTILPLSLHDTDSVEAYTGVSTPDTFDEIKIESALDFYNALSRITSLVPPANEDRGVLNLLQKIGCVPGGSLTDDMFTSAQLDAINAGYEKGRQIIACTKDQLLLPSGDGGFKQLNASGIYNGDYYKKSALLQYGLFTYDPSHFLYAQSKYDSGGDLLSGSNSYEIRFSGVPEAAAGWSLTLYSAKTGALVKNDMSVYQIGSRTSGLQTDADGTLTVYVSQSAPADKTMINNWLYPPDDNFYLVLRVYLPGESITSGQWVCPTVVNTGGGEKK